MVPRSRGVTLSGKVHSSETRTVFYIGDSNVSNVLRVRRKRYCIDQIVSAAFIRLSADRSYTNTTVRDIS